MVVSLGSCFWKVRHPCYVREKVPQRARTLLLPDDGQSPTILTAYYFLPSPTTVVVVQQEGSFLSCTTILSFSWVRVAWEFRTNVNPARLLDQEEWIGIHDWTETALGSGAL